MKPMNNYIAVKIHDSEEKTHGGILLPDQLKAVNPKATVMAVADNIKDVKVGDVVYYHERTRYEHDGWVLIDIDEVMAVEI